MFRVLLWREKPNGPEPISTNRQVLRRFAISVFNRIRADILAEWLPPNRTYESNDSRESEKGCAADDLRQNFERHAGGYGGGGDDAGRGGLERDDAGTILPFAGSATTIPKRRPIEPFLSQT